MWQGLYLSNGDREGTINVGSAPDIFFSVKFDTSSPLFSPLSHVFKQVLSVWQIALPMSIKNTRHSDLWIKGIGFFLNENATGCRCDAARNCPVSEKWDTHTHTQKLVEYFGSKACEVSKVFPVTLALNSQVQLGWLCLCYMRVFISFFVCASAGALRQHELSKNVPWGSLCVCDLIKVHSLKTS